MRPYPRARIVRDATYPVSPADYRQPNVYIPDTDGAWGGKARRNQGLTY
jgi:hypothetical protein